MIGLDLNRQEEKFRFFNFLQKYDNKNDVFKRI